MARLFAAGRPGLNTGVALHVPGGAISVLCRGAPTVAQATGAVHIAPIAFGGASIHQGAGGFGGQAPLFGGLFAGCDALGGFAVEFLCYGRGPPLPAQGAHLNGARNRAVAQHHAIATAQIACGLGTQAIDLHAPLVNGISRQAAGLEEARAPEPFVQAHGFRRIHGCHCAALHGTAKKTAWTL